MTYGYRAIFAIFAAVSMGGWVTTSNWRMGLTIGAVIAGLLLVERVLRDILTARHHRTRDDDNAAWGQGRYGRGRWDQ